MVVHRRKKKVRHRGYSRHGWGARKKRRGAGNRGGRGMAGSGKRADQKKPTILVKYGSSYFGKHGFHSVRKMAVRTINLDDLEAAREGWLGNKLIKEEKGISKVELEQVGIDKLLGNGHVKRKWEIHGRVSRKAEEKVQRAGGLVVKGDGNAVQESAEQSA